jgi:RimJ/RimL family protein N-acetyltransferase
MLPPEIIPMPHLEPVTLTGNHVRLEPLALRHLDDLCEVGLDPSIWTWNPQPLCSRSDMKAYIDSALKSQEEGVMLPFATIEQASGKAIGSTRYGAIQLAHKRLEIGWTWIAPAWQRTAINTEAKLLMLRHAFDTLGLNRVEWKTDAMNDRSRNAILRLGATFEGTFRSHMVVDGGRIRDTVYYSVIKEEWPTIERALIERLNR